MKILYAHDAKLQCNDGAYYRKDDLMSLKKRFSREGDTFSLLLRVIEKTDIPKDACVLESDFKVYEISDFSVLSKFPKRFFSLVKMVKKAVIEQDVVIATLPSFIGIFACYYAKKLKKPYLVRLSGDPVTSFWYHGIKGKLIMPYMFFETKRIVKHATHVIYVSRHFLQKTFPTKGKQLACPDVKLEIPDKNVLKNRIKKIKTYSADHAFVLGLIGSLDVDFRGHGSLIRAIRELKKRGIFCKVRFLGNGEKKRWNDLAERCDVAEQIEFSGFLPQGEEVMQWIDQIDILVMPTQQETLGRAIIEAMSRGCPVIGSIETAIREQIGVECLCKAQDYRGLAELIEYMIHDIEFMSYCAYENFYRSFKYTDIQTDKLRRKFYDAFYMDILRTKELSDGKS